MSTWIPKTFDDIAAVLKSDHPHNAALRQVSTYWEMVYGMAFHGICAPEFLLETCGEGIFFYARLERFLDEYRAATGPRALKHSEWITKNTDLGKALIERQRGRIQAALAASAAA
jgi:hypothetical protein